MLLPRSSVSLAFAVCLGAATCINACSGNTDAGPAADGGLPLADAGDSGQAGDDGAPPKPGTPLTLFGAYAVKKVYLGETDRSGVEAKDAWKQYGENLDGIVSSQTANGECKLVAGADSAKREDGTAGIDNSFGRTVLGVILGFFATPTKSSNDAIATGARTMVVNLQPSPPRVGFLTAAAVTTPPLFDGTDARAAAASSVRGAPDDALSTSTTPSMSGGIINSGPASGTFYLELTLQEGATWRLPIRHARVSMTISADGLSANGTISGIMATEELVAEFAKVAARVSTELCGGSTLDTLTGVIRQASDILVDGTQVPTQDCNGISVGIGFEASKVTPFGVEADPAPSANPCDP